MTTYTNTVYTDFPILWCPLLNDHCKKDRCAWWMVTAYVGTDGKLYTSAQCAIVEIGDKR